MVNIDKYHPIFWGFDGVIKDETNGGMSRFDKLPI